MIPIYVKEMHSSKKIKTFPLIPLYLLSAMAVHSFLDDLHASTNKFAVRVTLLTKWCTITETMLMKSTMVFGDQKVGTMEISILISYISS